MNEQKCRGIDGWNIIEPIRVSVQPVQQQSFLIGQVEFLMRGEYLNLSEGETSAKMWANAKADRGMQLTRNHGRRFWQMRYKIEKNTPWQN